MSNVPGEATNPEAQALRLEARAARVEYRERLRNFPPPDALAAQLMVDAALVTEQYERDELASNRELFARFGTDILPQPAVDAEVMVPYRSMHGPASERNERDEARKFVGVRDIGYPTDINGYREIRSHVLWTNDRLTFFPHDVADGLGIEYKQRDPLSGPVLERFGGPGMPLFLVGQRSDRESGQTRIMLMNPQVGNGLVEFEPRLYYTDMWTANWGTVEEQRQSHRLTLPKLGNMLKHAGIESGKMTFSANCPDAITLVEARSDAPCTPINNGMGRHPSKRRSHSGPFAARLRRVAEGWGSTEDLIEFNVVGHLVELSEAFGKADEWEQLLAEITDAAPEDLATQLERIGVRQAEIETAPAH